jgi:phage terminase small subunit
MTVINFKNFDAGSKSQVSNQTDANTDKFENAKAIAESLLPDDWDDLVGVETAARMRKVWFSLAPGLVLRNRLNDLFIIPLAELCYYKIINDDLKRWLATNGLTYETEGRNGKQYKNHPQVSQQHMVFSELMRCIGKFGLTPADEKLLQSSMQLDLEELSKNGFGPFAQTA